MRSIPEDAPEVPMEGYLRATRPAGAEQLHQVPSLGNLPDGVFRSVRRSARSVRTPRRHQESLMADRVGLLGRFDVRCRRLNLHWTFRPPLLRLGLTVRTAASARPGPGKAARSCSDSPPHTPYRSPYWIA
jgi:hypothetical protein